MFFEIAQAYFLKVVVTGEDGVPLKGAIVEIYNDRFYHRKITDGNGTAQIYLPPDFYTVEVMLPGYEKFKENIPVEGYVTLRVILKEPREIFSNATSEPVKQRDPEVLYRKAPSLYRITFKEISEAPGTIFDDPVNFIKLLPGVASRGPYTTDLYIRGGSSGETAVFWDGAFFPSPYHFNSLLSVFIQDAVSSMDFYSGAFPSRYGGVLSGIVDIRGKTAQRNFFSSKVGLVNTYLMFGLAHRVCGGRLSLWAGLRRTYFDLIIPYLVGRELDNATFVFPNYLDFQGKLSFVSEPHGINAFFEHIHGKETFLMAGNFSLEKETSGVMGISAEHEMVSDLTIFSIMKRAKFRSHPFSFNLNLSSAKQWGRTRANVVGIASAYRDVEEILYRLHVGSACNFTVLSGFLPPDYSPGSEAGFSVEVYPNVLESTHIEVGDISMSRDYGGNFSYFSFYQNLALFRKDYERSSPLPEINFGFRENYATYPYCAFVVNPRVSFVWSLGEYRFLKLAYGKHNQFEARPQFFSYVEKVDVNQLKPSGSHHFVVGLSKAGRTSYQLELYYKYYPYVYELDETFAGKGAALSSFLKEAQGYSLGADFLLRHKSDWFEGWLTASFGMARRYGDVLKVVVEASPDGKKVDYLYDEGWFVPSYERRYVLNAVGILRLGRILNLLRGFNLSLVAVLMDGTPYTPVVDRVKVENGYVPVYGDYNSDRLPPYRDVTLRISYRGRNLGFYLQLNNLFNFKNVYSISYSEDFSRKNETAFPGFYPSFGLSLRF